MDIPFSLELIVTITLFIIAAAGSVMAYFIADIRNDLKKIWSKMDNDKTEIGEIKTRVEVMETRMNICKQCPSGK